MEIIWERIVNEAPQQDQVLAQVGEIRKAVDSIEMTVEQLDNQRLGGRGAVAAAAAGRRASTVGRASSVTARPQAGQPFALASGGPSMAHQGSSAGGNGQAVGGGDAADEVSATKPATSQASADGCAQGRCSVAWDAPFP